MTMSFMPEFITKQAQDSEAIQPHLDKLYRQYYDLQTSYEKALNTLTVKKVTSFTSLKNPSNSERVIGVICLLLFSPLD